MIFEDNFANDLLINELNDFDSKKSVEEILWELDNGKPYSIDDEHPLAVDNKITLPIYDYVSPVAVDHYNSQSQSPLFGSPSSVKVKDDKLKTEELLEEFHTIYDAVELNHLTPPQTPPSGQFSRTSEQQEQEKQLDQVFYTILHDNNNQFVQTIDHQIVYQPQQTQSNINSSENSAYNVYNQNIVETVTSNLADQEISIIFANNNNNNNNINDNSADVLMKDANEAQEQQQQEQQQHHEEEHQEQKILRELQVVDELVRSRAKDLLDDDEDYSSGISSVSFSPRSDESSSSGFSQDDDEWSQPSTSQRKSTTTSRKIGGSLAGVTKRRPRPYVKGSEDKKSRKKEQNKNAATRYRQKKKQEIEVILDEEKILMDVHQKFYAEYKDKKRELSYLKNLLKELFKAKGLL